MRAVTFTVMALCAFAANSLLCRMALASSLIGPAAFTAVRLVSGALMLVVLASLERGGGRPWQGGSVISALALLAYAATFSFGYVTISTGTGALILFAAVQITMIGGGLLAGRQLSPLQWLGALLAMAGLAYFLFPGARAPEPWGASLMAASGVAWGLYSLRQRRSGTPLSANSGNFLLASLLGAPLLLLSTAGELRTADMTGVGLAVLSGAVTSGIGYAIWYRALDLIKPAVASIAQLSVPLIAAGAGIVFLGEAVAPRFSLACVLVLGGIVLVLRGGRAMPKAPARA